MKLWGVNCHLFKRRKTSNKKKVFCKADGFLAEDLLQSALHHYSAATDLLGQDPAHYDSGGYLLQLSFELLFKSVILHHKGKFDGTHKFQTLRQQMKEVEPRFNLTKEEGKVLDHLDRLYVLRYPNRNTPTEIGSEELELAKNIAEKIWKFVPDSLKNAWQSIPSGTKGGRVLMVKSKDKPIDMKFIIGK